MIIVEEILQNSPEWDDLHIGIVSASGVSKIITSTGKVSGQREKYLFEKVGERVTGQKAEGYTCKEFERGHEREDESRDAYKLINDSDVVQVGFVYLNKTKDRGCSPDGLVGDNGMFETKDAKPSIQISRLENGWANSEYRVQVQTQLYICEREWCDLQSYSRGFRPLTIRKKRDEEFIKKIASAIDLFNHEVIELVEKYSAKQLTK